MNLVRPDQKSCQAAQLIPLYFPDQQGADGRFCCFVLFFSAGNQTQGFACTRQLLCTKLHLQPCVCFLNNSFTKI